MKSGPSDTTRRRGGAHTLPGSNEKSKDSSDGSDLNTPLIHQKTVTWQNLLALLAVAAQTGMTRSCKLSGGNSHFPTTVNGTKILKMDGPISQPNQALEVEFHVPPEWHYGSCPWHHHRLRSRARICGSLVLLQLSGGDICSLPGAAGVVLTV
jgi:hypothetical protein